MSLLVKRGDLFPSLYGNSFDDFFKDYMTPSYVGNTVPALNVSEEKGQFKIEVAAPGMEKADFKLSLDHNVLTISCEKKKEEEQKGIQLYLFPALFYLTGKCQRRGN
jgi:HSP20 family protein